MMKCSGSGWGTGGTVWLNDEFTSRDFSSIISLAFIKKK